MHLRRALTGVFLLLGVLSTAHIGAQDPADEIRINTMRPVIRGRTMAAASMKPEATQAAERLLRAGGNAFDAAVAVSARENLRAHRGPSVRRPAERSADCNLDGG